MGNTSSHEIYNDVKKTIKKTMVIIAIIIALLVALGLSVMAYDHISTQRRESKILDMALPFTKSHTSWVFTRNDFGKESKLELWFLGDTDSHAIIKVNEKYSVYSTSYGLDGVVNFYRKAGSSCDYASAISANGEITEVSCDENYYSGGPWNKFR